MWRSSGRINFVVASSTALEEPGIAKMGLPRVIPATARESMAPEPIWSQLNMRKSSPKPGRGVSMVFSMTSMV